MVKMRRFMVQTKKAEVTKYKELDPIILANLWTLCQITMAKLKFPIVACELGRFYNKESVIELLLDRHTLAGKFPPEMHKKSMHIRNMKDMTELTLVINPNHKKELTPVTMLNGTSTVAGTEDGSPYHCPITGLEMNGRYRFVFFLTCGCVVSERAYQNVTDGNCPKCGKPYGKTDCVDINPVSTERKDRAKENMELRREIAKEARREAKLREKVGDTGEISKEDNISAWLNNASADRRGSSSSSVDTGISDTRRLSMVSGLSATGSIGEAEDKQARKRRLEAWAKEERRKSLGDEEKAKRIRLIKEQLLKKKRAIIAARIAEESSDSDSSDSSSDSD